MPLDLTQECCARLAILQSWHASHSVGRSPLLELAEGLNLESQVRRDGPLPCALAAWFACQLADLLGPDGTNSGADFPGVPVAWQTHDAYFLGSTLHFLLTGDCELPGEDYRPMVALRPDVPIGLELLCARLMAEHPDEDYSSADEVAAELLRWAPRGSVRRASRVSRAG